MIARIGGDPLLTARRHAVTGWVHVYANEWADAVTAFRACAQTLRDLDPHPAMELGECLTGLAGTLSPMGHDAEAIEADSEAVGEIEKAFGPHHPALGIYLSNQASNLSAARRFDDAIPLALRSLAITREVLRDGEAMPDDPDFGYQLEVVGETLLHAGRHDEAMRFLSEAYALFGRIPAAIAKARMVETASDLGACETSRGNLPAAERYLHEALAGYDERDPSTAVGRARAQQNLSELRLHEGRPREARAAAERALLLLHDQEVRADDVADVRFLLARAVWADARDAERARALASEARAAYQALKVDSEADRVTAWLATLPR